MPQADAKKKRIVYLFGAGATHAELASLVPALPFEDKVQRRIGLLISHVSTRVINEATGRSYFLTGVEFLGLGDVGGVEPTTPGSLNIELLISLMEHNRVHDWQRKTRLLKTLVQSDIRNILTPSRRARFYLHRALFEFHRNTTTNEKEELFGLISLNYDSVLDEAYREFSGKPNYCASFGGDPPEVAKVPLLKLHGSFSWRNGLTIRGRTRTVEIIPLGADKNYTHAPYSFIWGRALEVLIGCDTLRVIGCSLSQNDNHLVDLLFKAHVERDPKNVLNIEIISSESTGERIRQSYRFFPGMKTLTEIENLVAQQNPPNPFRTWLSAKAERMLGESVKRTRYLKRLKG